MVHVPCQWLQKPPENGTAGGPQNETPLEKVTPALNIAIFGTYIKYLIMAGQPTLPGPRTPPQARKAWSGLVAY